MAQANGHPRAKDLLYECLAPDYHKVEYRAWASCEHPEWGIHPLESGKDFWVPTYFAGDPVVIHGLQNRRGKYL